MFGHLRRPVAAAISRSNLNNFVRRHGHAPPQPGDNLPFDIHNRYKLTLYYALFMASGIGIPFLAVRHQLLKQ